MQVDRSPRRDVKRRASFASCNAAEEKIVVALCTPVDANILYRKRAYMAVGYSDTRLVQEIRSVVLGVRYSLQKSKREREEQSERPRATEFEFQVS